MPQHPTNVNWSLVMGKSGDMPTEKALVTNFLYIMYPLFCKKHHSYGPHNISVFGEQGVYIRMWDKMQRIRRYMNDEDVGSLLKDEGIDDTLMDIAIYAMIAILVRHGDWPKYPSSLRMRLENWILQTRLLRHLYLLMKA